MKKDITKSLWLNICANFLGKGVSGLLGVVFVPIYTRIIGIESLGILGLFATVQGALVILDMGLSTTVNRELALASSGSKGSMDSHDLVRTLEWIYWIMAFGVALILMALAPLVPHWVKADALSPGTIVAAGMLLAAQLAVQFPQSLYTGGLQGLEKQVLLNSITSVINIARHVGVILPLLLIKPDIIVFVSWQIAVITAGVLITRWFLWRSLPPTHHRPRFSVKMLKQVRRFSIGVGATAMVTVPLTIVDKVILSKILPLPAYGYYMLAWQGALGVGMLVTPFFSAFFPRFASVIGASDDGQAASKVYATACQLLSMVLAPAAASAIVFVKPLTQFWLHFNGPDAANLVSPILAILVAGTYCNGLMHLPYAMILAKGHAQFAFVQNGIALLFYLPLIYFLTIKFGAVGSATCWLILNAGYVVLSAVLLHKWFLPGQFVGWMKNAVILPCVVAFAIAWICSALIPEQASVSTSVCVSVVSFALGTLALALLLPRSRELFRTAVMQGS